MDIESSTKGAHLAVMEAHELKTTHKRTQGAIVLIPQPSDDPRDPLNWSNRKKYFILAVLCFASFAGTLAPVSHQLAYVTQRATYRGKTPIQLSYSIPAAVAGLFAGPIIFLPLTRVFGRSSIMLWSLLLTIVCQIWAASMTGPDDYIPFIMSRMMAGLFGGLPSMIGPSYVMDIFYLHQRGKAFTCQELSLLLGIVASPTIGGFVVQRNLWPYTFWWTIGPIGLAFVLVFLFVEETGFAREEDVMPYPERPRGFLANRVATFFPGTRVVPRISARKLLEHAIGPFKIAASPVAIIAGGYAFIAFGFTIMLTLLSTIFLQTPPSAGGYGFTPIRNAYFTFTAWVGLIAAELAGVLMGDKIPLWASRRFGNGVWHPEYRLWNMFLPVVLTPIGLGIFGAALQYKYHYMVLALGSFIVNFTAILSVPVLLNYLVECFTTSSTETTIAFNMYRLAFSLALPFFFEPWREAVGGAGWLFGMAAFFCVFGGMMVGVLAWKGPVIRRWSLGKTKTEEGEKINVSEGSSSRGSEDIGVAKA